MGWDETDNGICWKMKHLFPMWIYLILPVLYLDDSSQVPGLQSNTVIKLPGLMSCFVWWTSDSGFNCAALFKEWVLSIWFIGLEPPLNYGEFPISVCSLEFTCWWQLTSSHWAAGYGTICTLFVSELYSDEILFWRRPVWWENSKALGRQRWNFGLVAS